jgi:hypothetical protein
MKNGLRVIFGVVLLSGMMYGPVAIACSTDGWLGGVVSIPGNGVVDSPPSVSRYSGFCALEITETSHVQSNYASDARYRARFYVLDGLTGTGDVEMFTAYIEDAATNPLFNISFDGTTFTFDASPANGGTATVASENGWNLIEFDWDSVGGTLKYWVNADASVDPETGSVDAGDGGTVEAVRLGALGGFGGQTGKLTYDAFESHRLTSVGQLLACDAEGDAANNDVDINDALATLDEVFANPSILAQGQPDCDLNGSVNINDALAILDLIF